MLDRILAAFTAGRIVTILTPILFVPLSGYLVLYAAKMGIDLGDDQTLKTLIEFATFGLGALIAAIKSSKWMKAYREWELRQEQVIEGITGVPYEEIEDKIVETIDEELEKKYAEAQPSVAINVNS